MKVAGGEHAGADPELALDSAAAAADGMRWIIGPHSSAKVARLHFRSSTPGMYSGFVHVATSKDDMVVPVQLRVARGGLDVTPQSWDLGYIIDDRSMFEAARAMYLPQLCGMFKVGWYEDGSDKIVPISSSREVGIDGEPVGGEGDSEPTDGRAQDPLAGIKGLVRVGAASVMPPTPATCSLLQYMRPGPHGPPGNLTDSMHRAMWPRRARYTDRVRARQGEAPAQEESKSSGKRAKGGKSKAKGKGKKKGKAKAKAKAANRRGSAQRSSEAAAWSVLADDWNTPLPMDEDSMLVAPQPAPAPASLPSGPGHIKPQPEWAVESELTTEEAASMDPWDLGGREAVIPGASLGVARVASLDDEYVRATDPDGDGLAGSTPPGESHGETVAMALQGNRVSLPWKFTAPRGILDGSAQPVIDVLSARMAIANRGASPVRLTGLDSTPSHLIVGGALPPKTIAPSSWADGDGVATVLASQLVHSAVHAEAMALLHARAQLQDGFGALSRDGGSSDGSPSVRFLMRPSDFRKNPVVAATEEHGDGDSEESGASGWSWNAAGGLSPVIGVGTQHLRHGDAHEATERLALAVEFRARVHVTSNHTQASREKAQVRLTGKVLRGAVAVRTADLVFVLPSGADQARLVATRPDD